MTPMTEARDRSPRARRRATTGAAVIALVVLASACLNNGTWSAAPAPVAPVQALETVLADVSCVSPDQCLAVGSMGFYPLAEVWDGSGWSVVTAPSLGGQTNTRPQSVDCGTATSCLAKVERTLPSPDVIEYVVAWDGEQWHEVAGAQDAGYVDPLPYSCAPDGTCLIVDNASADTVVWDGDATTTIPFTTTSPGWDVNAVDCLAANLCVAATSFTTVVWNGATWSELAGSDHSAIFVTGPSTLACSTAVHCVAAGTDAEETGPTFATWDGSAWTEAALPAGVTAVGTLECVGADQCLLRAAGVPTGLIAWMGDSWYPAPAPPTNGGVSCLALWCLGVGSAGSPTVPAAATYEWTNP